MKTIKFILAFIGMLISGLWGGQKNKGVRRFGVPLIAVGASQHDGFQWRDLAFLLLIPVLCLGYGENSHLMQLLGNDTLVRGVYALLLSLPFYFYGFVRGMVASCSLILAFQVRAGSLGTFAGYDILLEDIFRYVVLASLVIFNITMSPRRA